MPRLPHTAIYTDNLSRKKELAGLLLSGDPPEALSFLKGLRGGLYSNARIASFLEEEARHDYSGLGLEGGQKLATFSSGERRRALLEHLLSQSPDFLILDNVFDNLDRDYRRQLNSELSELSGTIILIQFLSRQADLLPFIERKAYLKQDLLTGYPDYRPSHVPEGDPAPFFHSLPPAPYASDLPSKTLVAFKKATLSYADRIVLKDIDWNVQKGEFWELRGPNGGGKTSLITMINGDNPKAYGQEIYLFGRRKGSGESVWDIKKKIGYFTPALTDRFKGYHQAEHMLISGLTDSVGLYTLPSDRQLTLARQWLQLLGMEPQAKTPFHQLSEGQQRLLMCARAMIKHPPLLILDEPTAGLDEASAALVVSLVRKIASESDTAVIFVSHREEPGLQADQVLELIPREKGSEGIIHRNPGR